MYPFRKDVLLEGQNNITVEHGPGRRMIPLNFGANRKEKERYPRHL